MTPYFGWIYSAGEFLDAHNGAVTAVATVFIGLFTVALVVVSSVQGRLLKRTADAALKSAHTAERSLALSARPYIAVSEPRIAEAPPARRIRMTLVNHGTGPAIIKSVRAEIQIATTARNTLSLSTTSIYRPNSHGLTVEVGEEISPIDFESVLFADGDMREIARQQAPFILSVFVDFADIFGSDFKRTEVWKFDAALQGFRPVDKLHPA
jgi:hypothetical protein